MAWRPANSLVTLRNQLDVAYPGWLFLGFLGDQAHASVPSDHNPTSAGVVTALDIGPGGGLDIHALADRLLANRHPDLKYIISNRRIAGDWTGWRWARYDGSNPHDTHIHISVGRGPDGQSTPPYDDTINWNIGGDEVIQDKDNYYQRYNKAMKYIRGRELSREDFKKIFVGHTDLQMLESLLDNPEADANYNNANLGRNAQIKDTEADYARYNQAMLDIRGRALTKADFKSIFVGRTHAEIIGILLDDKEAQARREYIKKLETGGNLYEPIQEQLYKKKG